MKSNPLFRHLTFALALVLAAGCTTDRALESITADPLRMHLEFIASDEMMGRDTPSPQLRLAARYLAIQVAQHGFEPLMPDGSYLQTIPLEQVGVDAAATRLSVGGQSFSYGRDFGGRFNRDEELAGTVVFAGWGMEVPEEGWNDYAGLNVSGRVVVLLDGVLAENHPLMQRTYNQARFQRANRAFEKGAVAVIEIIRPDLQRRMVETGQFFTSSTQTTWPGGAGQARTPAATGPVLQIRHEAAAALLGVTTARIQGWFDQLARGSRVPNMTLSDRRASMKIALEHNTEMTENVVAWIEGSDSRLKEEYVVIGSHYDHVGTRQGEIYNGSDDNGSGTVGMLEIARALSIERPKRSVVMVWHTGEEKGLRGARHFVQNSPIPIENVTAMLQLDMISRNHPDSIYVIGSHFVSSELDSLLRLTADRHGLIALNDRYNDPDMQGNYFRQSDHFAYHQVGIPTIFFFSGTHEDLHRPTDTVEKADFDKMTRVTRLVYALTRTVGNHPGLLTLDRNPDITERGVAIGGR